MMMKKKIIMKKEILLTKIFRLDVNDFNTVFIYIVNIL